MKISVVGLGFVGLPLYLTLLNIKNVISEVLGIEDDSALGKKKIKKILCTNKEYFYNEELDKLFLKNKKKFNITNNYSIALNSDYVFICLPFNIDKNLKTNETYYFNLVKKYYLGLKKGSTIILNSTLPPGYTTSLIKKFKYLKIFRRDINIVYSPERVEPGLNYYKSIVESPRVFSSNGNKRISNKISKLFSIIFNSKKFRLVELKKYEEAELCKILENSYRAANIAMIEEWGVLSEKLGINIYSIIDAIKQRKTHSNIMRPGLGVGGYCLTKDPYFAKYSSINYLKDKVEFPFVDLTMRINAKMHFRSISLIKKILSKNNIRQILLVGISYTDNVDDLRNSRGIDVLKSIKNTKYKISVYDPLVKEKEILKSKIINKLPKDIKFDLIILINNNKVKKINFNNIKKNSIVIDLNHILKNKEIKNINKKTKNLHILGRGDI